MNEWTNRGLVLWLSTTSWLQQAGEIWDLNALLRYELQGCPPSPTLRASSSLSWGLWDHRDSPEPSLLQASQLLPSPTPPSTSSTEGLLLDYSATSEHRLPLMLRRHPVIQLGAPSREHVIMSCLGLVMTAPCHCAGSCPAQLSRNLSLEGN